jgi:thymidylate synthase ThyX
MPAEKCAYALARYSRSADSIRQSLEWVRGHDSHKFLESFYFQYGHASIADLGHVALCFEGISELAATEIEDEQLWDGQARSSRYQDFSKSGMVTPPELSGEAARAYHWAGERLLAVYGQVHQAVFEHLAAKLPRPGDMKVEAYERNRAARAFDVARYLLFLGVPTSVGQVTSIRTLERQVRRLKASEYRELNEVGDEMAAACAEVPGCALDESIPLEPIAPTLAKYVSADAYLQRTREDLRQWAAQNLPPAARPEVPDVDLLKPPSPVPDIVATLLYPVTDRPYRELYGLAEGWSEAVRREVLDLAVRWRGRGDDLLRAFRGGPYVFDIIMDAGAWRDLHRHRRCHQFRQAYTTGLGYETPAAISEAGVAALYDSAMQSAIGALGTLPEPAAHYLIPFAAKSRFLFKMDFAEAEYIARLRSGLKGHFSYRGVAWKMKEAMDRVEPELGRLIQATPPWMEDPLRR